MLALLQQIEELAEECFDPPCPGDLNDNLVVNGFDFLILLDNGGECSDPADCPADLNDDGVVNVFDLLLLLDDWGPC